METTPSPTYAEAICEIFELAWILIAICEQIRKHSKRQVGSVIKPKHGLELKKKYNVMISCGIFYIYILITLGNISTKHEYYKIFNSHYYIVYEIIYISNIEALVFIILSNSP